MGVIWLQTANGKLIHVPIVGPDFNMPSDPEKVPTSVINTANRCLSGQITITWKGQTVTFDFDPPGRTGSCIQCGQCCTHAISACPDPSGKCGYVLDSARGVHKCQYLTISPKGLGKANGALCSIRASILENFKGCTIFPEKAEEIANCPSCGFRFGGV